MSEIFALAGAVGAAGEIAARGDCAVEAGAVRRAGVGHGSVVLEEGPDVRETTALAGEVTAVAGDLVLGRENDVDLSVAGDAESVGENFGGGEGPAASAVLLRI